mmetsp:Transcript_30146/g.30502  ORF Transcript_30146/g.30502 Transcript_30146/m.30502 type:complete len:87 (+) Transcript_30146:247-507(+)
MLAVMRTHACCLFVNFPVLNLMGLSSNMMHLDTDYTYVSMELHTLNKGYRKLHLPSSQKALRHTLNLISLLKKKPSSDIDSTENEL